MEQSTHNVDLYHLDSHEKDKIYKHFYILPYGETRLIFNDLTLKINREKTSMEPLEFHNGMIVDYFNDIYIECENYEHINSFVEESIKYYSENFLKYKKKDNKVKCFIYEDYWVVLNERDKRNFDTIYLDKNIVNNLLNDVNDFLDDKTKEQYKKFGIPYKKNYLFEGITGGGKTSTAFALASKLDKDIAILNFDDSINDSVLMQAMQNIPDNCILCIEDIDVLFQERKNNDSHKHLITFSGLLNVLDGHTYKEGLITIITTNYADRLDKAFKRAGRIDYILRFNFATTYQIKTMYNIFFPERSDLVDDFVKLAKGHKITTAMLQQFFFTNKNDVELLVKNIDSLYEMEKNNKNKFDLDDDNHLFI